MIGRHTWMMYVVRHCGLGIAPSMYVIAHSNTPLLWTPLKLQLFTRAAKLGLTIIANSAPVTAEELEYARSADDHAVPSFVETGNYDSGMNHLYWAQLYTPLGLAQTPPGIAEPVAHLMAALDYGCLTLM